MAGCEAGAADPLLLGQLEGQQSGWVQIDALPAYGQVEMRSGGPSCASAKTDLLPALDPLSLLYLDFRKMKIKRQQSLPVIEHDAVTFEIQRTG